MAGMVLWIRRVGVENRILRWIKGLYYARRNRGRFPGEVVALRALA